jgi:hypothetical protein
MNRPLLILTFLLASIAHAKTKPNILFIYTDDHSHRTVNGYPEDCPDAKTPIPVDVYPPRSGKPAYMQDIPFGSRERIGQPHLKVSRRTTGQ